MVKKIVVIYINGRLRLSVSSGLIFNRFVYSTHSDILYNIYAAAACRKGQEPRANQLKALIFSLVYHGENLFNRSIVSFIIILYCNNINALVIYS